MKVLVIGTDRAIFEEGSLVRERIIDQGALFRELHVVVFAKKSLGFRKERLAENVWAYPTNSFSKLNYVFDASALGKKICREKFFTKGEDLISAQDPFECGLAGILLARAVELPLQVQIHTDFLSPYFRNFSLLNRLRCLIAEKIIPKASGVRVVSRRIADSLSRKGIKTRRPVDVLPVFADFERFEPVSEDFNLRRKYPQFDFIMLCVGRLAPEKNFILALRALRRVVNFRPKTGLFFVGEGAEKDRLVSFAKKLGLEENVVFVPSVKNLYPYYKSADVFLMTSFYEGYGLVLAEAALLGCPVVSADVGVAGEIIPENFRHFICPVGDERCFTGKIKRLAESADERTRYGSALAESAKDIVFIDKNLYLERYFSAMSKSAEVLW